MDKELLFKRKAAGRTREVPIEDVGIVTVRALSREEVKACKDDNGKTQENKLIARGMVDPVLTPEEVSEWLDEAPAGDSLAVMDAIADLSGMAEGAQKSGVPDVRGRSRR